MSAPASVLRKVLPPSTVMLVVPPVSWTRSHITGGRAVQSTDMAMAPPPPCVGAHVRPSSLHAPMLPASPPSAEAQIPAPAGLPAAAHFGSPVYAPPSTRLAWPVVQS